MSRLIKIYLMYSSMFLQAMDLMHIDYPRDARKKSKYNNYYTSYQALFPSRVWQLILERSLVNEWFLQMLYRRNQDASPYIPLTPLLVEKITHAFWYFAYKIRTATIEPHLWLMPGKVLSTQSHNFFNSLSKAFASAPTDTLLIIRNTARNQAFKYWTGSTQP